MRIVLIGQAAFGEKVLRGLIDSGEQVVGAYTPVESPGRTDSLKQLAIQSGIPVFQPTTMRSKEVFKQYSMLEPELNIMAFVTSIIPENILSYPRLGTIQYHPSVLPKHRGGSAINWAIIKGENRTGISIFWPDKGIDTGPLLLQKQVEISPDDTVGTLYFNKLFPMGVEAIMESIELIKKGVALRIPQDETKASYEGLCTGENTIIDWKQPAINTYNLIRGADPQPGASTRYADSSLKLFSAELIHKNYGKIPGEIVSINEQGFMISVNDEAILVKRVRPEGSQKIEAAEFARQASLAVGSRLGD